MAGITRQAIYAIEANLYLPTTAVALRLAGALDCRVEDLFSLVFTGEVIEGDLLGALPSSSADSARVRVKVARVGERVVVRPVATLGGVLNYTVPADGLIIGSAGSARRTAKVGARVRVQLLRDRRMVEGDLAVAGCDPAIFLAGEHLRRRQDKTAVVGWTMGSDLPYLRRHLKGNEFTVVTFATWEEGFMVRAGNPKGIREVADLARKDVKLVNREEGSGARLLLDQKLVAAGIKASRIRGYQRIASSHFEVARVIAEGQADVGIGVWSAARLFGLDFLPLQEERYDLVVPTPYLKTHPGLTHLLDTIVSRPFRTEIEALGGYDTRETGKIQELRGKQSA